MERPPQPVYEPYRCIALADRDDPSTHCMKTARLYACGWRCEVHRPGVVRARPSLKEAA